ncbi:Protein CLEC-53 [Aphelenchoides avenae]|nr:Protein CLEC-53 [Aphelenchus avenae]
MPTYRRGVDTVLEKKCNFLRTRTRTAFVGNSCFACTVKTYNTTLKEWFNLHRQCVDLNGYKGRMAFIRTREQIEELIDARVIKEHGRYFIGAKQDPPSDCGGQLCRHEEHIKQWYYIDEKGVKQGELNKELWLRDEPNNQGEHPPENVVTLEQFDSQQLGFNDANGEQQHFPILCEYENVISCKDGWTLINDKCYKVFVKVVSFEEAKAACAQEGPGAQLPSIHNDRQNTLLAALARHTLQRENYKPDPNDKFAQYGPVLFGLRFDGSKWNNLDGTLVDYYRWWSVQGQGHPNLKYPPRQGYTKVFLLAKTNGNDGVATFGYWLNGYKDDQRVPAYLCEIDPFVKS